MSKRSNKTDLRRRTRRILKNTDITTVANRVMKYRYGAGLNKNSVKLREKDEDLHG